MNPTRADFIFRLSEYFLEAQNLTDGNASASSTALYYIPKMPLAQAVDHFAKNLPANAKSLPTHRFLLDLPFLNSLLTYSLGGSVAQLRTQETDALLKLCLGLPEKTDSSEEDLNTSWGAQNLTVVFNDEQLNNFSQELQKSLEQLKAKGAKRVVLQIAKNHMTPTLFDQFHKTCTDLGLVGFPKSSETLDYAFFISHLIDASLWGRYLETTQMFIDQIRTLFPTAEVYFCIDQKLHKIDELENFCPSQLCDHHTIESNTLDSQKTNFLYAGVDAFKWMMAGTDQQSSLVLTSLLHLDQLKDIELLDQQLKMSPGPMCFGRGSKLMLLDFLIYQHNLTGQQFEVHGLDIKTHLPKVEQALQNLWRLSSLRSAPFAAFLKALQKTVDDHLRTEMIHFKSTQITGPLSSLFQHARMS